MRPERFKNILILTGAGISAESGIRTFRDNDGLWENHRVEDVATPEAFAKNPSLVHRFYNLRRKQLSQVLPNPAHTALAKYEAAHEGEFTIVTQNVDDLHERAGSQNLIHMHGELTRAWCTNCDRKWNHVDDLIPELECSYCNKKGVIRPDIVWFGEAPYHMSRVEKAALSCDLFVAIGTSGLVYPAAGLVQMTSSNCWKVEINAETTPTSPFFDEHFKGKASARVPEFLSLC